MILTIYPKSNTVEVFECPNKRKIYTNVRIVDNKMIGHNHYIGELDEIPVVDDNGFDAHIEYAESL